jgi:S1-C subfamily serine protease
MKSPFSIPLLLLASVVTLAASETAPVTSRATPKDRPLPESRKDSVVRVNSTNQEYDFFRPWSKKAPISRRGLGVVIDGGRILVTAQLIENTTYIELEKADGGEKTTAQVQVVDYESNLATLTPTNSEFLRSLQPLDIDPKVKTGDRLDLLQLESNGTPVSTQALLTSVEVGKYTLDDMDFLLFKISCPLQYRENSFTLPLVKDNRLAAFLMRYDPRSQTIDAVPGPVIAHFLKEAEHRPYRGFPRLGIGFSPTRDPQLRRYLKLQESDGGVYVNEVDRNGPAAKAGIEAGDILLSIGDKAVDPDGNYTDSLYGKLSIVNLTTDEAYSGQQIPVTILRGGERRQLEVTLFRVAPEDYVIAPYLIGEAPRYYVLGGMVFQELSRQYLREWGPNWAKEAPQRFVYFDRFQSSLFPEPRKIVILSQVMPTRDTVGYEQLNYLVVTRLNGVEIKNLDDFAKAAQSPINGFHKLEFDEDPHVIYLDAAQAQQDAPALQKLYALPALQRL